MMFKTMIACAAILLLAVSHASAAFGAVQTAIDCTSKTLSAEELASCAESAVSITSFFETKPSSFSDEIDSKIEALKEARSVKGHRKLLTSKSKKKYPVSDLETKTVECSAAPKKAAIWGPCLDKTTNHEIIPCEATGIQGEEEKELVCAKKNEHWAQCVPTTHNLPEQFEAIVVCSGEALEGLKGDDNDNGPENDDAPVPVDDGEVGSVTTEDDTTDDVFGLGDETNEDAPAPAPEPEASAPEPETVSEPEAAPQPGTEEDESDPDLSGDESPAPAPSDEPGDESPAPAPSDEPGDESPAPAPSDDNSNLDGAKTTLSVSGKEESCPSEGRWSIGDWNLAEVIGKNFLFFEAQQSGELPASHRVKWRGDSYLHDKHKDRLLNYGWFDAGDHLKLVFPMGWTVSTMAWGILDTVDLLKSQSFDGSNNLKWAIGTLEYGLRFLLDCSYDDGEFVAQVGNTDIDHKYVLRAELDDVTPRTDGETHEDTGIFYTLLPKQPGGDLLFQAAAAYAAGALALRKGGGSEALADRAEKKAREVFAQAKANPGIYSQSIPESDKTYPSDNFEQYGFLAAAWMFRLTGEASWQTEADEYMAGAAAKRWWPDYSWGSVYMGAAAVMWQATGEAKYEEVLAFMADEASNARGQVMHTPKGLLYTSEWGPLRHAVGSAGVMALYARGLKKAGAKSSMGQDPEEIIAFAESQVTYMLGASGHSWIVGFGCDPPVNPHHRDSALTMEESGDWDKWNKRKVNANSLIGALVGGPDKKDKGNDDRNDYRLNEVALDYNCAMFYGTAQVAMYFWS